MNRNTHVRPHGPRLALIALGSFFALVTGYALFKDVIDGAAIRLDHVTSLGALVGALAAGHHAWPELRRGNVAAGLALGVMFAAASFYVVVSSAARNAEAAQSKVAGAVKANGDRERAEVEYKAIAAELVQLASVRPPQAVKAAMDAAPVSRTVFTRTAQCVDVTRPDSFEACRPILELRQEMAAAIRKTELEHKRDSAQAALDRMGPAVVANGGYKHAARVLATLPGVTGKPDEIEARLTLLMPFLVVLVAEVGTIAFLGLGLGSHGATVAATVPTVPAAGEPAHGQRLPMPVQRRQPSPRQARRFTRIEAEADLVTMLALGATVGAQDELAARWGVGKALVSKWLKRWEQSGTIPTRRVDGRRKVLESV